MPISNARFPYKYDQSHEVTVYVLVTVINLFSFGANLFVLFLVRRMRLGMNTFSHQLITCIAGVDFINTIFIFASHFARVVMGFPDNLDSAWYCRVFGLSGVLFPCFSGVLVSMLAFERFFLICLHRHIDMRVAWGILGAVGLTLAIPAIGNTVLDGYSPDPTFSFCWPNGTRWAYVENNVITYLFIAPLCILTFCYVAIFITCFNHSDSPTPAQKGSTEASVEAARMSKKVAYRALVFIFFYFMCFGPKVITTALFMSGFGAYHPFVLYIIDPFGIQLVMCVNPILVLFLHRQFKAEAKHVLRSNRIRVESDFKMLP
ncbi:hypothetical protein DSO57_1010127 [Entomophthora muscae]|uniref:Uncharacterized protein n=1 Tax=Entomophthora muscae TaxID=34485 RepID=A0ACC2SVG3_9FUNG|nr:hypothetical protein DSO57_1010127 [Entomophthora muscae]